MRYFILVLLTIFITRVNAQSFSTYKDTVHHFSISYPADWIYEVNDTVYKGIVFSATRVPVGKGDYARDNININIINTPRKDLEKSFSDLLRYLSPGGSTYYKPIEKGDTTLNGIKFKWLIETHKMPDFDKLMHNYDFLTVKDGKTYILTMTTFSSYFDTIKPLFDKIAGSFIFH